MEVRGRILGNSRSFCIREKKQKQTAVMWQTGGRKSQKIEQNLSNEVLFYSLLLVLLLKGGKKKRLVFLMETLLMCLFSPSELFVLRILLVEITIFSVALVLLQKPR